MTKEQIGIWLIVGVMAFSVVGIGLAVLLQDNPQNAAEQILADNQPDPIFPEGAFITEEDVTELEIVDVEEGEGAAVELGDSITVHYQGTLADTGEQFDSSYDRGEPTTFDLVAGGLIDGWVEGIPGMKIGGKRRLVIPSELAYGAAPRGGIIGANADLVFEIELIDTQDPAEVVEDEDADSATEADSEPSDSDTTQ